MVNIRILMYVCKYRKQCRNINYTVALSVYNDVFITIKTWKRFSIIDGIKIDEKIILDTCKGLLIYKNFIAKLWLTQNR
jgi:hypothetical protein